MGGEDGEREKVRKIRGEKRREEGMSEREREEVGEGGRKERRAGTKEKQKLKNQNLKPKLNYNILYLITPHHTEPYYTVLHCIIPYLTGFSRTCDIV